MARAIRTLGKEKYGDTIYRGRFSQVLGGKRLDIPVSLETAWGHSYHWQGRGLRGLHPEGRLAGHLPGAHDVHAGLPDGGAPPPEILRNTSSLRTIPATAPVLVDGVIMNQNKAELKDSVTSCEWQSPDLFWPEMEAEAFSAATGIAMTEKALDEAAERSRLLFRAILIRNFGRDRALEVGAVFPTMQYPDPWGETVSWEDWNDLVDLYYEKRGWDKNTGWPTRETLERFGLKDVADTLNALGKLPV